MKINEAIRIYNLFFNNPKVKQFEEARSLILEEISNRKPREEYYKSSNSYDYYILYPYKTLEFSKEGIEEVEHCFDCVGRGRKSKSELHFCLSLCKMSENEIIEMIDSHIKEDNEKYLQELMNNGQR